MKNDRSKSTGEWVQEAERLARENGGNLPFPSWLQKNGYAVLSQCMGKYPELFVHMPKGAGKSGHIPGTGCEGMLETVKAFAKDNGRLPDPKAQGHEKVLGLWCRRQRQKYGSQCQEMIRTLESIPNWYWSAPGTKGLNIGDTFSSLSEGANALRVGGRDDLLVVHKSPRSLALIKPDGSEVPLRDRGVTMLCACGKHLLYVVGEDDAGLDTFVGLDLYGTGDACDCGKKFNSFTIYSVEGCEPTPRGDEVRLGSTLWELAEGANALMVNGSEETLVVEGDDNSLFLRQNGKDTSIVGMVLVMYCAQCTRVSAYRMEFDPECGHEVFGPIGDVCGCDMDNQAIIAVGPRNDDMKYENWQEEEEEVKDDGQEEEAK